ncbi:MAG TPA: hypothetical protein VFT70_06375 [Nocardioides sp.]|nr:hypothetical protein [Nocardioides sp.]
MSQAPLLERNRVLTVLLSLAVLVAVGWVSGRIIGALLVRLVGATLGVVSGGS